jgi:hypothetical protein
MIRKLFDPNRTIRHVSYRQERLKLERQARLSDQFFGIMIIVTLISLAVFGVISLMVR